MKTGCSRNGMKMHIIHSSPSVVTVYSPNGRKEPTEETPLSLKAIECISSQHVGKSRLKRLLHKGNALVKLLSIMNFFKRNIFLQKMLQRHSEYAAITSTTTNTNNNSPQHQVA